MPRAVAATASMTAEHYAFSHEVLGRVATRVILDTVGCLGVPSRNSPHRLLPIIAVNEEQP